MEVTEALAQLGGSADAKSLRQLVSRRKLRKAVVGGHVVRHRPGSYALPTLDAALSAVRAAHGARSHLSAALHWGWELKQAPPLPMITVPRGRNLSERRRAGMQVFWAHLTEDELEAGVTAPLRTVIDCAQRLPWDVALADVRLGIVIEAESQAFHGNRTAFDKDVRRYTAMTREGWLVLRFLWNEVMHDPDYVLSALLDAVRLRSRDPGWSLSAALAHVDHPS